LYKKKFEIKLKSGQHHCDVTNRFRKVYFLLTGVYIVVIMLIPILTIFISNSLILYKTRRADMNRLLMQQIVKSSGLSGKCKAKQTELSSIQLNSTMRNRRKTFAFQSSSVSLKQRPKIKPFYPTYDQKQKRAQNTAKRLKKILLIISFSYAFFNLPYLITWLIFFFKTTFNDLTASEQNYLFSMVQLSEIF